MTKTKMRQLLNDRREHLIEKIARIEQILNNFPTIDSEIVWRGELNEAKAQLRELDYIYLVTFEL